MSPFYNYSVHDSMAYLVYCLSMVPILLFPPYFTYSSRYLHLWKSYRFRTTRGRVFIFGWIIPL